MNRRLEHIDALRGLAALAIILFHLVRVPNPNLPVPDYLNFIPSRFGLGVPMFFIISGFSIYYSLSSRKLGNKWVAKFFLRRYFRLAPLFYFMLGFFFIRGALRGNIHSFHDVVINLLLVYNLFPGKEQSIVWAGWPISIEIFFYLAVPFFYRFIDSFWKSILLLLFSIFLSGQFHNFLGTLGGIPEGYHYKNIATHLPFLSIGIVSFFVHKEIAAKRKKNNAICTLLAIFVALFLLVKAGTVTLPFQLKFYDKYLWGVFLASILVLLGSFKLKIFVNPVTEYFGKISYSLYLGHPFIIYSLGPCYQKIYHLIDSNLPAFLLCVLLTVPLVILVASLLYYLIENPVRNFSYARINKYCHC
jgi:peptidoglycan/LPS O-acetylase OafA/YrhL